MQAPAPTQQNTVLVLRHSAGVIPNLAPSVRRADSLHEIAEWFRSMAGGAVNGMVDILRGSTAAVPIPASGTLALSSGSGAVGGTINGVTVTDTWATSDTVSAGLIVAAINASTDALVQGIVRASNKSAYVTVASGAAGDWIEIDGVRFTARAGTTGTLPDEFSIGDSDTNDAVALVAAINAHPELSHRCKASNSSGVVTIRQYNHSRTMTLATSNITRLALNGGSTYQVTLAAAATVLVSAIQKGKLGNCVTLAASGTGVTASGARLTGGVGGDSTSVQHYT